MTEREMLGTIYREAPLTPKDYDDAIEELQTAKANLEKYGVACSCDDCFHNDCYHNPLTMARHVAEKRARFRCYHCGDVFYAGHEADEHFGLRDSEMPLCRVNWERAKADPPSGEGKK